MPDGLPEEYLEFLRKNISWLEALGDKFSGADERLDYAVRQLVALEEKISQLEITPETISTLERLADLIEELKEAGFVMPIRTEQIVFQQTLAPLQGVRLTEFVPIDGKIISVALHFPGGCFIPQTPIVMADNTIKPIEEVKQGDRVLCHNSVGEVSKTYTRDYTGDILNISVIGLPPIQMTPEHPVLVVKSSNASTNNGKALIPNGSTQVRYRIRPQWEPQWVAAAEVEPRDWVVSPIPKIIKDINKIDILNIIHDFHGYEIEGKFYCLYHKKDWVKWKQAHFWQKSKGQLREKYSKRTIPRMIELSNDFLRLVGYFLAEGNFRYDCKKYPGNYQPPHHPTGIMFSFGIHEKEYVYLVHSYYVPFCEEAIALTDYGRIYASALQKDNFYGVQFHPEKSSTAGDKILTNFLKL